jgi:hypothetical protein
VLLELRGVAIAIPEVYVSASRFEGGGQASHQLAKLGKDKQVVVDVVAIIERDVLVLGLRPPDLGRDVDHKRRVQGRSVRRCRAGDEAVLDIEERHQGFAWKSMEVPLEIALAKVVGSVDAGCRGSVIEQRVVGADPWIHLIDGKHRKGGSVGVASKETTFVFVIVDGESDSGVFAGDRAGTKVRNHP